MFYRFNYWGKVVIIAVLYCIIMLISFNLFKTSLEQNKTINIIGINFIQCWNLMLCGFFFFQAFKGFRFSESFYKKNRFESALLYKLIGLEIFRFILVNSFFKYLNKRVYLKGKPSSYLRVFIEETKQSETSHVISIIFTLSVQLLYLKYDFWVHFYSLSTFTIIFNVYPLLLQRMNRNRVIDNYPNLLNN